jgi:hypothetical protein
MKTINNFSRRTFLPQSFGAGAFVLGARFLPTPAMATHESDDFIRAAIKSAAKEHA